MGESGNRGSRCVGAEACLGAWVVSERQSGRPALSARDRSTIGKGSLFSLVKVPYVVCWSRSMSVDPKPESRE